LRALRRRRWLAVAALRLAGFEEFVDPEMAGLHVMLGQRPLREPSVLRQTVLTAIRLDPQRFVTAADEALTAPMWALMARYDAGAAHGDIERWLGLFLRMHHVGFLDAPVRLSLGFALVEGLLGRFRAPDNPASVEAMVARLLGHDAAAQWFTTQARSLRNALAHGRAVMSIPPGRWRMLCVGRAALPRAIALWLDQPDSRARPARLLMRSLAA
jgi:hypothetical protein